MEGIFKTQVVPHLLDGALASLKASGGLGHLQLQQVLVGTLTVEALEEPAQVGLVHAAGFGDFIQSPKSQTVPPDELPAGLRRV
jgi:hypothetical protein